MKKSEIYQEAMRCVVESELNTDLKLEIIETLVCNKRTAEFSDKREETSDV